MITVLRQDEMELGFGSETLFGVVMIFSPIFYPKLFGLRPRPSVFYFNFFCPRPLGAVRVPRPWPAGPFAVGLRFTLAPAEKRDKQLPG